MSLLLGIGLVLLGMVIGGAILWVLLLGAIYGFWR